MENDCLMQEKTSIEAVTRGVDRFGGLTGVCLNAGIFGPCHRMRDSAPEKWMKGLQVNLLSHLHTVSWQFGLSTMPYLFGFLAERPRT